MLGIPLLIRLLYTDLLTLVGQSLGGLVVGTRNKNKKKEKSPDLKREKDGYYEMTATPFLIPPPK